MPPRSTGRARVAAMQRTEAQAPNSGREPRPGVESRAEAGRCPAEMGCRPGRKPKQGASPAPEQAAPRSAADPGGDFLIRTMESLKHLVTRLGVDKVKRLVDLLDQPVRGRSYVSGAANAFRVTWHLADG